tara:strand:- start:21673 stop:21912 length:240 start_codon:yes stop_codon:yes gene_type:complete
MVKKLLGHPAEWSLDQCSYWFKNKHKYCSFCLSSDIEVVGKYYNYCSGCICTNANTIRSKVYHRFFELIYQNKDGRSKF